MIEPTGRRGVVAVAGMRPEAGGRRDRAVGEAAVVRARSDGFGYPREDAPAVTPERPGTETFRPE
ncbi:hypothetical protein GCM10010517_18420 [Streptosporangium fragile]|uniref:Uncharacterized protein n=1 Tax=Streptosporangium fragile TaxID=46186 RepID=A0ABN3VU47_9ACTN